MWIELIKAFLGKQAGERLHVSVEEGQSLISSGLARAVSDDPLTPVIARGIEAALQGWNKGLDAIINQTLKQFADAQQQSRRVATPILFGDGNQGDAKKSFGDWALAVARGDRNYLERHYGSSFVAWQQKAALAEASGVTGGYTVPPEFYQQLQTIMAETAIIRPRAFVLPMASATMQLPYLDVTTVQSAGSQPLLWRHPDVLDRGGTDQDRDRATVQADGAEGLGAVWLHRQFQCVAPGQRCRPGDSS